MGMSGQLNSLGVITHFANRAPWATLHPGLLRPALPRSMPGLAAASCLPCGASAAAPACPPRRPACPLCSPPRPPASLPGPPRPPPSAPHAEVGSKLVAANLGWPAVFGLLNVAYYVLHYMFASQARD